MCMPMSHEYANEANDDGIPNPAQSLNTPMLRQKNIEKSHSMYSITKIGHILPNYHTCIVNRIDYHSKWLLMHY